jgi:hypothetical protein
LAPSVVPPAEPPAGVNSRLYVRSKSCATTGLPSDHWALSRRVNVGDLPLGRDGRLHAVARLVLRHQAFGDPAAEDPHAVGDHLRVQHFDGYVVDLQRGLAVGRLAVVTEQAAAGQRPAAADRGQGQSGQSQEVTPGLTGQGNRARAQWSAAFLASSTRLMARP